MLFFKNTSNRIMNKKGKSMISKKMGKNKVGLRSLLAKFMVLMLNCLLMAMEVPP